MELESAYISFVAAEQRRPASPAELGFSSALAGEDFPAGWRKLEAAILRRRFDAALRLLSSDARAASYNSPETLLALFFTWFEQMGDLHPFMQTLHRLDPQPVLGESYLAEVKPAFLDLMKGLVAEGVENGAIARRWGATSFYPDLFWAKAALLMRFWLYDDSPGFERTDAAIEKSLRFLFDLIQPNALDSGTDLFRFLFRF
jgi:hypothetical protein